MSEPDYTTTIGSTADTLVLTLTDANGAIDLSTAETAVLRMRLGTDGELLEVDLMGSIAPPPTDGVIEHAWTLEDYPETAGVYSAQIVVTFEEGTTLYVPNERVSGRLWYRFEFLPALS